MVNFLHRRILCGNRRSKRAVAFGDPVCHAVEGAREGEDLIGRIVEFIADPEVIMPLTIDEGEPAEARKPFQDQFIYSQPGRNKRQGEGQKRNTH